MILGTMLKDVRLTGTRLELQTNQLVLLVPATNIPNGKDRFYAIPALNNDWGDASILLDVGDVITCK